VGQTKGALVQLNLTASTDLRTVEEFRSWWCANRNGTLVRLPDIADVVMGADTTNRTWRMSGQRAVFIGRVGFAQRQLTRRHRPVNAKCNRSAGSCPPGMMVNVAYDSTKYIKSAIKEVVTTLAETVLIVMVVIFLFLGSLRTVLVPWSPSRCRSSARYS